MKGDDKALWKAATLAQNAADYLVALAAKNVENVLIAA